MRVVETQEEGEELINRFKKAVTFLEELPMYESCSVVKLWNKTTKFKESELDSYKGQNLLDV